jgi:hypothetical protein
MNVDINVDRNSIMKSINILLIHIKEIYPKLINNTNVDMELIQNNNCTSLLCNNNEQSKQLYNKILNATFIKKFNYT